MVPSRLPSLPLKFFSHSFIFILQIFARGGYNVNLYDTNLDQITAAVEAIRQSAETLHTNDLLFGQSVEDVMALIEGQPDLNKAIEGAIYAQECTPESVKIKSIVFNNLDKAATETKNTDIILASSSSNIYPSQFTSELKMKANCLVAHPVNPPFAIPVVEVVPAPHTDPKVRIVMLLVFSSKIVDV